MHTVSKFDKHEVTGFMAVVIPYKMAYNSLNFQHTKQYGAGSKVDFQIRLIALILSLLLLYF